MEILVHNLSHADLIVRLEVLSPLKYNNNDGSFDEVITGKDIKKIHEQEKLWTLARPKFSMFMSTSLKITHTLDRISNLNGGGLQGCLVPMYQSTTSTHDTYHSSPKQKQDLELFRTNGNETEVVNDDMSKLDKDHYPIGFNLEMEPIRLSKKEVNGFLLKDDYILKLYESTEIPFAITAVYFPLLALLIPKWKTVLKDYNSDSSQKLLYLISGAGIPRSTDLSIAGNSTEETAKLMIRFVDQFFPQVQTALIHSGSNIFRYDDNVAFVNCQLRPHLEDIRQTILDKCGDRWKSHFHITLAYAGGTPARLSALNASLRLYKPSYLHIWQLKTFWHEFKLSFDDIDFHSFEKIETSPAIPIAQADSLTRFLVSEMIEFRNQFQNSSHNELKTFWLRKTNKPVLSILIIQKPDQKPKVYRGMNVEVSMPTGSLCAERNVIGSALANDPTLRRTDLKLIGVLSMQLEVKDTNFEQTSQKNQSCTFKSQPEIPSSPEPKRPRTFSCEKTSNILSTTNSLTVDLNPLAPCGACKEWLLKIAEGNPTLRVVTFTDTNCQNIFINQIV